MDSKNAIIICTLLLGSSLILAGCGPSSDDPPILPNPAGALQFSSATYSGPEGTANIVITVSRTGGTEGAVSVDYSTSDGTATVADSDYTAIPATTLNWADGDGADQTFNVVVNTADTKPELTEDLTVTLSNVVTADLGSINSAVVSITDDDSVTITGTLTAPGAILAMVKPTLGDRLLSSVSGLFFGIADAAIGDPVPGTTVEVYEVDNNGAVVGAAITTSATDGAGTFTLAAPLDAPASKYIVRADDGAGNTLDSRINFTTTDVDPVSDATSFVIATNALDLAALDPEEVAILQNEIEDSVVNVDSSGSASAVSSALVAEAANNTVISNLVTSSTAPGSICGTVTKALGVTPMENILVIARDFGDWVTRAKVLTAVDGTYCMNVPAGDYIVGAINSTDQATDPDKSASEWYNAAGDGRGQTDAEAVTVAGIAVNGIDFDLVPGARIQGTMTTPDAGSAEGIKVLVRDYDSFQPIAWARVEANGTFRVSVPAGDYLLFARNRTLAQPYATIMYNASNASVDNNRSAAGRNTVVVGATLTANFTLALGNMLSGQVLDAPAGSAAQGVRVRADLIGDANYSGTATRMRTKKDGSYRVWLKPDNYNVRSRGQGPVAVDMTGGNATVDFSAQQGTVTGILQDGNSNPVGHAKIMLYTVDTSNATDYSYNLISQELSNGDGSFKLYATTGASYKLLVRIDSAQPYSSLIYGNVSAINAGTNISVTTGAETALGTITLPTQDVFGGPGVLNGGAGLLSGTLGNNAVSGIPGGQRVEVRYSTNNNTTRFFRTRTRGDGSYVSPMPADNYQRVRIAGTNYDNVTITNGATTTVP